VPDRTVVVGFEGQRSHVATGTTVRRSACFGLSESSKLA
jgi:hypothetical protein